MLRTPYSLGLGLLGLALAATAAGCGATTDEPAAKGSAEGSAEPSVEKTQDAPALVSRHAPHALFKTPATWTGGDQDNVHHLIGGTEAEHWVVFQNSAKTAALQYYTLNPPATPPARSVITGAIEQGLAAQQASSKEQLLGMRETAGHGCLAGGPFEYVEKPAVTQTEKDVRLVYGYTCTSQTGPIRGYSITAYDWLARKHSATIDATTEYWEQNPAEMSAVIDSFGVTGS